jgi:predicted ArsR family transcriptional regulator
MQVTRQQILEILKERDDATIDEIVEALRERIGNVTAVTVRHHLEILRGDGLVATPSVRRRSTPGRPQYIYTLTERAVDCFPNNYQGLTSSLLGQMKDQLTNNRLTKILDGVATEMAGQAMVPNAPLEVRLDHVVTFLKGNGYDAFWKRNGRTFELCVTNCPYAQVAADNPELCAMDKKLLDRLVGRITRRATCQLNDGEHACKYVIAGK